jgi:hypothetical protein
MRFEQANAILSPIRSESWQIDITAEHYLLQNIEVSRRIKEIQLSLPRRDCDVIAINRKSNNHNFGSKTDHPALGEK